MIAAARVLAAAWGLSAAACSTGVQAPREVLVPVPVACLELADVPARPAIAGDGELAKLPDGAFVRRIWSERERLAAYALGAEILLRSCARSPAGKAAP